MIFFCSKIILCSSFTKGSYTYFFATQYFALFGCTGAAIILLIQHQLQRRTRFIAHAATIVRMPLRMTVSHDLL